MKVGDLISVRESSKSLESIKNSLSVSTNNMDWLEWNNESFIGKIVAEPARNQIPENIKEQLIVELYSK